MKNLLVSVITILALAGIALAIGEGPGEVAWPTNVAILGGDGNGARVEMDINSTAMTCGSTPTGTQMCMEFRDDGASPGPIVWVQEEGQTAYPATLQHYQIRLAMTNATLIDDELNCQWDDSWMNNQSGRPCDGAGTEDYFTMRRIPNGMVMLPIAIGLTVSGDDALQHAGESGTLSFAYCTGANYAACFCPDGDTIETCTEMEITAAIQFGDLGHCADDFAPCNDDGDCAPSTCTIYTNNIFDLGESYTYWFESIPEATGWWTFILGPRQFCDDTGEPCTADAQCTGNCLEMAADCPAPAGGQPCLQWFAHGYVDLFYVIMPERS